MAIASCCCFFQSQWERSIGASYFFVHLDLWMCISVSLSPKEGRPHLNHMVSTMCINIKIYFLATTPYKYVWMYHDPERYILANICYVNASMRNRLTKLLWVWSNVKLSTCLITNLEESFSVVADKPTW